MGKKKNSTPSEEHLLLVGHPSSKAPVVDTHTHLVSTFSFYQAKYKDGRLLSGSIYEFAKEMYRGHNVEAIVDVYCEAPVERIWKEIADSALTPEDRQKNWNGTEYWFVMGVHPHEAKNYNDDVERDILEAMNHPRCVGWGEIGLDYHYDNSPREIQQNVFRRQLRHAIRLGKPLTIHTREAEEDTERILKEEAPKDHKIHIHCFTDSPEFAQRLLDHFPNLYVGITGVITYSTNLNTSAVIRNLAASESSKLRIVLETDAPFMVPGNIYKSPSLTGMRGKFPLCHTGMLPWTAEFVADVAGGADKGWDVDRVMGEGRENARSMYGI
ncbi:hydrolase [Punctularia strigosozonata HHB-11173 SS5]|uniref:hydrolase n=1 Tax=Punctularia strigosozonata (strain HHB-11173) TaxID=741275 RepID=UPI0004416E7E|nr:hydrolase [Punctularia strigosozonata HHB-11173 SS5]EIN06476.1 hydrolase [Punctularia strigosozonata HHB-11173 SS5]